jgi:hypothetical protein
LENDSYKLYFDRTVLTDIHIQHNRPDIIILNKQQKQAYHLDILGTLRWCGKSSLLFFMIIIIFIQTIFNFTHWNIHIIFIILGIISYTVVSRISWRHYFLVAASIYLGGFRWSVDTFDDTQKMKRSLCGTVLPFKKKSS